MVFRVPVFQLPATSIRDHNFPQAPFSVLLRLRFYTRNTNICGLCVAGDLYYALIVF